MKVWTVSTSTLRKATIAVVRQAHARGALRSALPPSEDCGIDRTPNQKENRP